MKTLFTIHQALLLLLLLSLYTLVFPVKAESAVQQDNTQVIQAFTSQEQQGIVSGEDQSKHLIMFVMGVPLLVLLLVTGALGIAMGIYGKQVFIAHMVFAGLSVTLAIAHAIVGIVWFYPF
jgi:uncharacterized protein GlcG (DUF336 family)